MNDAELRELQRQGKSDPAKRFRFFGALDRKLSPEFPPVTQEIARATDRFQKALRGVLRRANQERPLGRVEPLDVARALSRLDATPESDGVRWVWLDGPPPYARSNKHTVVLIVAEAGGVAIDSCVGRQTQSGTRFFANVLPHGNEGADARARWSQLERNSAPAHFVAWARHTGNAQIPAPLRVPADIAVRWGRRLNWNEGEETPPSRSS